MKDCQIIAELSEQGIVRVEIHADNADEKRAAHLLLARISPELDALDRALKSPQDPNKGRPIPFFVVFVGPALFKRIGPNGQVETASNFQDCAALRGVIVARAAAKILDQMGQFRVRFTTITNEHRPAGSISDRLTDFGFTSKPAGVVAVQ